MRAGRPVEQLQNRIDRLIDMLGLGGQLAARDGRQAAQVAPDRPVAELREVECRRAIRRELGGDTPPLRVQQVEDLINHGLLID